MSQPTYLSHLRLSLSQAQSGTDTALVTLTAVSMGVVLVQTLIGERAVLCRVWSRSSHTGNDTGIFSMNVTIPNNRDSGHLDVFGIVVALAGLILIVYVNIVRLWWNWAKRRRWSKGRANSSS